MKHKRKYPRWTPEQENVILKVAENILMYSVSLVTAVLIVAFLVFLLWTVISHPALSLLIVVVLLALFMGEAARIKHRRDKASRQDDNLITQANEPGKDD